MSNAVILRYPYLPYWIASSMIRVLSRSSSSVVRGVRRCVFLSCPSTVHARLSETPSFLCTHRMALRLFDGLKSFPPPPLSKWHYPGRGQLPASSVGHSLSLCLSAAWPAKHNIYPIHIPLYLKPIGRRKHRSTSCFASNGGRK